MTEQQYIDKWFGILDSIKDIIEVISPSSDITTRIITGKGLQDTDWIGYLRNLETDVVDRWLISIRGGKFEEPVEKGVGYFNKPVKIGIFYFADYRQGYDFDADLGKTNSEREFLTKCIKLDWKLETLELGCLPGNVKFVKGDWDSSIMKFSSDNTHHASFPLEFKMLQIDY